MTWIRDNEIRSAAVTAPITLPSERDGQSMKDSGWSRTSSSRNFVERLFIKLLISCWLWPDDPEVDRIIEQGSSGGEPRALTEASRDRAACRKVSPEMNTIRNEVVTDDGRGRTIARGIVCYAPSSACPLPSPAPTVQFPCHFIAQRR